MPLTSLLTCTGGAWLTAVNPPLLLTEAKPLLTEVNPDDETGLGCGEGARIEVGGGGCGVGCGGGAEDGCGGCDCGEGAGALCNRDGGAGGEPAAMVVVVGVADCEGGGRLAGEA